MAKFKPKYPIHWPNVLFLTLSLLVAVGCSLYYIPRFGVHPFEVALFISMFFATGLSITGGYHRHFAHVSYEAHLSLRLFYLIFGACAMENSALNWASDHRLHHRFTDTDLDPYNAGKGFFWSHIGWILYQSREPKQLTNVKDLLEDKMVCWQDRYHIPIAILVGFGLPALLGLCTGRVFGAILWGALIRVVFVHHATFLINSWAHMYGTQPFSRSDSSRDSWWLAFLTNGEGYHNFHHKFPSDYRNGFHWYQWDPTKWWIAGFEKLGVTAQLRQVPAHIILRARMDVDAVDAERHLLALPHELRVTFRQRLEQAHAKLEQALMQWGETKAKYRELKKAAWRESEQTLEHWKEKVRDYEMRVAEAREHWRMTLQSLQSVPTSF